MPYQPLKKHNFLHASTLVPVLCATVLLFSGLPIPGFLSGFAQGIASPLWVVRDTLRYALASVARHIDDMDTLRKERDAILEELASLRRENVATRSIAHDIETLHRYIGVEETRDSGRILAPVLFDTRKDVLDMLVIGMGTNNGIRDRMLVTSPEGIAVGYINHAYDRSAHVRLFSSAHVVTGVVLYGSTTVQAMLEGRGAGTMVIQMPKDLSILVGTIVGLPTLDGATAGEVVAIETTPEDAFQTVYIQNPINQYELRYVLVDTTAVWEIPIEQLEPSPIPPEEAGEQ